MYWYFIRPLILFSTLKSCTAIANNTQLDVYRHIIGCEDSSVSLQLNWGNIDSFCEVRASDANQKFVSNMYFLTKTGKTARFCHSDLFMKTLFVPNFCFDLGYPKYIWKDLNFHDRPIIFTVANENLQTFNCYQKLDSNILEEVHGRMDMKIKTMTKKLCSMTDNAGYHGLTPEIQSRPNNGTYKDIKTLEKCYNGDLNHYINWNKIQLVCYHFKSHDTRDSTNIYFHAIDDLGSFRHCHGLADGFTSQCFPGHWSEKRWDRWEFSNGALKGETKIFGWENNNVHCYAKKGTMDTEKGMRNWYVGQPPCGLYDPAGFYGYDKKKHGP